jgi:hypothetical protein
VTRPRALLAVVVIALLAVGVTAIVTRNQPREYNARIEGFTCVAGDSRFLIIAASVGWNDHLVNARAHEDRDKVTVTVRAADPEPADQFQQLSAHPTTAPVVLREPIGARLVVDHDGRALQGHCP